MLRSQYQYLHDARCSMLVTFSEQVGFRSTQHEPQVRRLHFLWLGNSHFSRTNVNFSFYHEYSNKSGFGGCCTATSTRSAFLISPVKCLVVERRKSVNNSPHTHDGVNGTTTKIIRVTVETSVHQNNALMHCAPET